MQPENRTHRIFVIVAIMLLTSLVTGASIYYALNQENQDQQRQIEQLKKTQSTSK